jgi:hypothetical protein
MGGLENLFWHFVTGFWRRPGGLVGTLDGKRICRLAELNSSSFTMTSFSKCSHT